MTRPLLITDCDEVLLYMISHFREWLAEDEGVAFDMGRGEFYRSMRRIATGEPLAQDEMWALLNRFFDTQMYRQTPVEGAVDAIAAIREHADVVVLTNLLDFRRDARRAQLAGHGIDVRVFTNQGPKGPALQAILDEYQPGRAVFIDDLSQHHGSVFEVAPQVRRLHLCAEPQIAPHIPCAHEAGHAHARIDEWERALPWLLESLTCEEKDLQANE
ncbi:HAD family hydrolase [Novosphingobium beihaiensis]|uniref:HAD family hydrolase n=1 Tax=Novosphingobium beihaiensis TaxID=2930389 RepID=A0ABT0BV30_9SPHN|nr:HAD family hydrolase [Novosphingobium beihaiensis]MCJ2188906.1 HAD family hydrolase [Novosphingobium beihaiensis]